MELILPTARPRGIRTQVYATAKGMSQSDVNIVTKRLAKLINVADTHIAVRSDLTSNAIFAEYRLSLALG